MKWLTAFFVVVALVIIAFTAPLWAVIASVAVLTGVATYGAKKAIDAYEEASYSVTIGKKKGSTDAIEVIEVGPIRNIAPNEEAGPRMGPNPQDEFSRSYYDSLLRVYNP